MGKTSLATNIAFNIARAYKKGITASGEEGAIDGGVVGFFSLEMSAEQLATRILSEVAEIPSTRLDVAISPKMNSGVLSMLLKS